MDETTGFVTPPDPSEYEHGALTNDHPGRGVVTEEVYSTGASREGSGTDEEDTSQIRQGIEQTRANMSETIDAIQDRLSPQHLAGQAKDAVRDATIGKAERVMNDMSDAARDTGSGLLAAIQRNPLPAALAGIGLGWLVLQARSAGAQQRSMRYPPYRPQYDDSAYERANLSARDRDRSQPGDTGRSMTDQARDTAGQLSGQAQQAGDWVQDQAQQVTDQAQYQAQRVKGWLERTMDESPLVLGLVALAAGSLTGLAVPETQQEHQLMGPARDALVQQAQGAAQDTMDKAQQVSEQARKAATQEAQKQNLM